MRSDDTTYTQNVAGRILVGLRYWNQVRQYQYPTSITLLTHSSIGR